MVSKQLIKGCHDCFLSSSFSFDSFFIRDMIFSVYIHRSHTLVHAVWTISSPPPFCGEEELASRLTSKALPQLQLFPVHVRMRCRGRG